MERNGKALNIQTSHVPEAEVNVPASILNLEAVRFRAVELAMAAIRPPIIPYV